MKQACAMAAKHGRVASGFGTDECGICCEPWGKKMAETLHCGHVFHRDCIRAYQKVSGRCPVCRAWIGVDVDDVVEIYRLLQWDEAAKQAAQLDPESRRRLALELRRPWWEDALHSILGHVFQQASIAKTGKDASAAAELKWIRSLLSPKYDAAVNALCAAVPKGQRELLEAWTMSFEDRINRLWVEDWQRANAKLEFVGFALQCIALDLIGDDILYYSDFAKSWCRAVNLDVSPVWALATYPDLIRPRTTYKQDFDACYGMLTNLRVPPVLRRPTTPVVTATTPVRIILDDPQMTLLVRHYDVKF